MAADNAVALDCTVPITPRHVVAHRNRIMRIAILTLNLLVLAPIAAIASDAHSAASASATMAVALPRHRKPPTSGDAESGKGLRWKIPTANWGYNHRWKSATRSSLWSNRVPRMSSGPPSSL